METKNLWGDLGALTTVKPPAVILKEQAEILTEKTKGLLRGEALKKTEGTWFEFDLNIVVPRMGNYTTTVLKIRYPLDFFPLVIYDKVNEVKHECEGEESFVESLGRVLQSGGVRRILSSLISQAQVED